MYKNDVHSQHLHTTKTTINKRNDDLRLYIYIISNLNSKQRLIQLITKIERLSMSES